MTASPLISVAELRAALESSAPPAILDVRWRLGGPPVVEDHLRGHLPGAVFVDLDEQLADPPGTRGRHPLPDPRRFQAAMRAAGVDQGRGVVVYDDGAGMSAARAWWLLRHHGHGEVWLLDGGWAAWLAAGGAVETGEGLAGHEGDFVAAAGGVMPVLDADGAAAIAHDGVLVDARAAERYRGETEPIFPVAGHIPGARSLPTAGNVGLDGRFLDRETLARRFAEVGIRPGVDAAAYCGSGVTASHEVLAAEVAGITLALYPGSWSEWIADANRPVATGDETTVGQPRR